MGWFRRSRTPDATPDPSPAPTEVASGSVRHLPVPVATAPALERTERALQMLAVQSSQLHTCIVQLEHRVDALSTALLDQMERPSYDDVLAARLHSARTAAELARLEVNIAAKLDAVRAEISSMRGPAPEIDLRELTPVDTGWPIATGTG